MWGMHLYAGLILRVVRRRNVGEPHQDGGRDRRTCLRGSAGDRRQSHYELAAVQLLFFIDRGHLDLTERAFARSTAFAAAFAMLGQVRLGRGRLADAIGFYDRGIELAEDGSAFHIDLLVLKCGALLATGDRVAFLDGRRPLYAAKPDARRDVGAYLVTPEENLPTEAAAMLEASGETGAHALLDGLYDLLARHSGVQAHRENVMRGLAAHLARGFCQATWKTAPLTTGRTDPFR